jgi:Zn-dependent peptidase ImmA (M78 family)
MKEKIELNSEALYLRKYLGEDAYSPIDVFSLIADSDNITVLFYPMSQRISGICVRNENNKLIGINSNLTYGRQRFTVAHELCHLFFHEDLRKVVCSKEMDKVKDPLEQEADMFASYFLASYESLNDYIKDKIKKSKGSLELMDVVKIEQYYGFSRQAMLWRLVNDSYISKERADTMKSNIIISATMLGYDKRLYSPSPEDKKYFTIGKYIKSVDSLQKKGLISDGKYDELLLDAYRSDIVYGLNCEEEEIYD